MLTSGVLLTLVLLGQQSTPEPAHAANRVYETLLADGLTLGGTRIRFPAPVLRDGQSAEAQRKGLVKIAGSSSRLDELLRNSVTAPFLLKLHDETSQEGDTIRRGDLYFVVHADLDTIDPDALTRKGTEEKPVEAGNMRFVSHVLTADEQSTHTHMPPKQGDDAPRERFVHVRGRLLGRIAVESTDHIVASHSKGSWVVASRTDPKFDDDKAFPNRWQPIGGSGEAAWKAYGGGGSYVKISRLEAPAGALFVEAHFAFAEPRAWFDGAPILRSKLGVVAQDQIRRLRRELADAQSKSKSH